MKCYICRDLGFVLFTQSIKGSVYEFIAHCSCVKGNDYAYDGRGGEGPKSRYYVPPVGDVLPVADLIEQNRRLEAEFRPEKIA